MTCNRAGHQAYGALRWKFLYARFCCAHFLLTPGGKDRKQPVDVSANAQVSQLAWAKPAWRIRHANHLRMRSVGVSSDARSRAFAELHHRKRRMAVWMLLMAAV